MKYKYKVILIVVALLFTINVLLLTHYGLWSLGNKEEYLAVNTSGCINTIYSDDQELNLINPKALSDDDGISNIPNTITISNSCNVKQNVLLFLDIYDDSTISDNKMKVNINGDSSLETTILPNIDRVKGINNILNTYKLINMEMSSYETKRINFRVWLSEDEVLSVDKNRFHARYYVQSSSDTTLQNFKETIINNNPLKNSNGLLQVNNKYYFNGSVNNNYVSFANYLWRIVSINDDNSIKLIYENSDLESTFNNDIYKETSVSYDDSVIKNYLNDFYNNNLINYESYLKEENYCIDSSYTSTWRIVYNSYLRNFDSYTPSLECETSDKEYGGLKPYKIGLLTLDEVAIAGGSATNYNDEFYLNNNSDYYTLTPTIYNGKAFVGIVSDNGKIDSALVNNRIKVRPVINIDSTLQVTGVGSRTNPYIIRN